MLDTCCLSSRDCGGRRGRRPGRCVCGRCRGCRGTVIRPIATTAATPSPTAGRSARDRDGRRTWSRLHKVSLIVIDLDIPEIEHCGPYILCLHDDCSKDDIRRTGLNCSSHIHPAEHDGGGGDCCCVGDRCPSRVSNSRDLGNRGVGDYRSKLISGKALREFIDRKDELVGSSSIHRRGGLGE